MEFTIQDSLITTVIKATKPISAAHKAYNMLKKNHKLTEPGQYLVYGIKNSLNNKTYKYIATDVQLNGTLKTRALIHSLPKVLETRVVQNNKSNQQNIITFTNKKSKLNSEIKILTNRYNKEYDNLNSNSKIKNQKVNSEI